MQIHVLATRSHSFMQSYRDLIFRNEKHWNCQENSVVQDEVDQQDPGAPVQRGFLLRNRCCSVRRPDYQQKYCTNDCVGYFRVDSVDVV